MPRLHVVRAFAYSLDGVTQRQAVVAETLDLPERMAKGLLAERYCLPADAPPATSRAAEAKPPRRTRPGAAR